MPRLLQVNVTANWGSTGKIAESIGIAVMEAGWESFIVYGRWANSSQSHLIKVGGKINKYLHYAEQRVWDNEGLCSRGETRLLIRQIEKIKPDLVQLHNIHDHFLNYRILFEYLNHTNIKVVWTFHDCWAFTGHCFHFITEGCTKWIEGCRECPMKSIQPKTVFDRSRQNYEMKKRLFCGCKNLTIVSCSEWMAGLVRKSFLKEKSIVVINNGVDLDVFRPLGTKANRVIFRILAVSNVWNKEKGLYDLFKLRQLLPELYSITIIGCTEKQIHLLPLGIIGIERTQNVQELVQYYSDADVLVNPTYADTFPTVNLEALACGTPVITYRTGGSPEAVSSETGAVVEEGDVAGLAAAIKDVCNKGKMHYVKACRQRAEVFFNKNKCLKEYLELYEGLIASEKYSNTPCVEENPLA